MAPFFEVKRFGFHFAAYENRIEITEGPLVPRRGTIMLKEITSVDATPTGKLILCLTDGSRRTFVIGRQAETARRAIVERL